MGGLILHRYEEYGLKFATWSSESCTTQNVIGWDPNVKGDMSFFDRGAGSNKPINCVCRDNDTYLIGVRMIEVFKWGA